MREAPRLDTVCRILALGIPTAGPGEVSELRKGQDLDGVRESVEGFVDFSLFPRPAPLPLEF